MGKGETGRVVSGAPLCVEAACSREIGEMRFSPCTPGFRHNFPQYGLLFLSSGQANLSSPYDK